MYVFVFMSARFIMEPCQCAERVSLKFWRAIFIIESINKFYFDLLYKINLISMIVDLFVFFFVSNWNFQLIRCIHFNFNFNYFTPIDENNKNKWKQSMMSCTHSLPSFMLFVNHFNDRKQFMLMYDEEITAVLCIGKYH